MKPEYQGNQEGAHLLWEDWCAGREAKEKLAFLLLSDLSIFSCVSPALPFPDPLLGFFCSASL